jgi:hypothetical protein
MMLVLTWDSALKLRAMRRNDVTRVESCDQLHELRFRIDRAFWEQNDYFCRWSQGQEPPSEVQINYWLATHRRGIAYPRR